MNMGPYPALIASIPAAYLIGSFPTSYLIARGIKGLDIRQVGSQNAGATNVFRSVGKAAGLATLIVDILKGLITVTWLAGFFYKFDIPLERDFYYGLMGLVAVCGHVWSVFLKFRGGKGVATTIGVGIGLAPGALAWSVAAWTAVFLMTGYVSLASIIALSAFPAIAAFMHIPFYTILISILICGISVYKHKSNIERLVKGEERKTNIFGKS